MNALHSTQTAIPPALLDDLLTLRSEWNPTDDDEHTLSEWAFLITKHIGNLDPWMDGSRQNREELLCIARVALAAIETLDRQGYWYDDEDAVPHDEAAPPAVVPAETRLAAERVVPTFAPIDRQITHTVGKTTLPDLERDLIISTLELTDGNRRKTAKILDIGLRTLFRKINKYRDEGYHVIGGAEE